VFIYCIRRPGWCVRACLRGVRGAKTATHTRARTHACMHARTQARARTHYAHVTCASVALRHTAHHAACCAAMRRRSCGRSVRSWRAWA
jgi:hypothetical protein